MLPWRLLDRAKIPGSRAELTLHQRGEEFSIRTDGLELMNSRAHGSEALLAQLSCTPIAERKRARVLIGGLGMGYTLRAALSLLRADAEVVVAELVPAVVSWNRTQLAQLASNPLADRRVSVKETDVVELVRAGAGRFDAIVLDVDNGPTHMNRPENQWLYARAGLASAHAALRAQGVLSVWSVSPDPGFTERLRAADFSVEVVNARGHTRTKGARHTLWIATRSERKAAPAARKSR